MKRAALQCDLEPEMMLRFVVVRDRLGMSNRSLIERILRFALPRYEKTKLPGAPLVTPSTAPQKVCMSCKHSVFPPMSLGECHAPGLPDGTLLMHCRAETGLCGADGKLYEVKIYDQDP